MKEQILSHLAESFGLEGAEALGLLASYAKTLEDSLAALEGGAPSPETAMAAHSVKGCALNCGDAETAEIAKAAETAAKSADAAGLAAGTARLRERLDALHAEL